VAFAAAHGQPAFDSAPPTYDLSPFAQSLSEFLPVRGLEIADLFHAIHEDVERRTRVFEDGPQEPWLLDRIAQDFYFSPPLSLERARGDPGDPERDPAPLGISLQDLENGQEFAVATQLLKARGIAPVIARAEAGDPMAQYMLSYMLGMGLGIAQDHEASQRYLRLSAEAGNPAALTKLGFETVDAAETAEQDAAGQAMIAAAAEQDFGRAFYFLEDYAKAAVDGDAYSAFLLAAEGKVDQAFALLTGMAETGDDAAESWLCELAMIHQRRRDAQTACRTAANAGFSGAQAHAAWLAQSDPAARKHWSALGRPTVYFRLDRLEAAGVNTQIVLDQLVAQLKDRPWGRIYLEGHTDDWRSRAYSLGLGERLANSVRRELEARGIDPAAITTISFGSVRPAIDIDGFQPFNRRVEIRVEWLD
jgi:peptidoglycan-associated lipoprotein